VVKGEAEALDLLGNQRRILRDSALRVEAFVAKALTQTRAVVLIDRAVHKRFGRYLFVWLLKVCLDGDLMAALAFRRSDIGIDEILGCVPEIVSCLLRTSRNVTAEKVVESFVMLDGPKPK
jgi:hypothetical protein